MKKKPNILIISHARWGKDQMAEYLNEFYGFTFKSSSIAASEIFLFDIMKNKYGYNTPLECFEDRVNHRAEWKRLIDEYNKNDKARLAKEILKNSNIYVGMRDYQEIMECKKQGLFDLIIWVDSSKRLPEESKDSFNIDITLADIIVDNNGTLEEYKEKIKRLGKLLI